MSQSKSIKMEAVISVVLQTGVLISSAIILFGFILFLTHSHLSNDPYRQFTATNYTFPHSLSSIKSSIQAREGIGLIELGVLLLILTPIVRVAASIFLFRRQKELRMTLVTLFVLLVLTSSFILGITVR